MARKDFCDKKRFSVLVLELINTNRAEGRGANACLFYLTYLSNFIVTSYPTARGLI